MLQAPQRSHGPNLSGESPPLNEMPKTPAPAPPSFAALHNPGFRAQFLTYALAMMADLGRSAGRPVAEPAERIR